MIHAPTICDDHISSYTIVVSDGTGTQLVKHYPRE